MASGYNPANGKIYLAGGFSTGFEAAESTVWEFDPVMGTFTAKASLPVGLGGPAFGIIGGHLYVAGGRNYYGVLRTNYDFDIAANSWTTRATMPWATNTPGSGVAFGKLYAFGAGNPFSQRMGSLSTLTPANPQTTATTVSYDPVTNVWATESSLNGPRSFVGGTQIGSTLVAAGGYTGDATIQRRPRRCVR